MSAGTRNVSKQPISVFVIMVVLFEGDEELSGFRKSSARFWSFNLDQVHAHPHCLRRGESGAQFVGIHKMGVDGVAIESNHRIRSEPASDNAEVDGLSLYHYRRRYVLNYWHRIIEMLGLGPGTFYRNFIIGMIARVDNAATLDY